MEQEKQQEMDKGETKTENDIDNINDKKNNMDEVVQPNSWDDKNDVERNLSYEGPIAGMSGVRELSLDSLDVEISEIDEKTENESKESAKVHDIEDKKTVEAEKPGHDVPKTFYTITMAQVYINQKQYAKAREVLNYIESKDPFNEKVKSLIAQLDNYINEEEREAKSEIKELSSNEVRKKKALKLSELFETLNKNSIKEPTVKEEEERAKEKEKDESLNKEGPDKKEMDKFKDWLKGL